MKRTEAGEFEALLGALQSIRAELLRREAELEPALARLRKENRPSARNLVHYVALRSHDLRGIQEALARHGLSSLGRAEPHVLWNLEAVLRLVQRLVPRAEPSPPEREKGLRPEQGQVLLRQRTEALLGPAPAERSVRIMVTMPSEAATDYTLVRDLLDAGMNCMRINCAHDTPSAWEQMVTNLRRAEQEVGRRCRVLMDLPGPRVRTGPIEPGPQVTKIKPRRDALGRVTTPAHVWLTPTKTPEAPSSPADARLPLPLSFLARLSPGAHLRFEDTRGRKRSLRVVDTEGRNRWVESTRTAYVATGTRIVLDDGDASAPAAAAAVGPLPPVERRLHLRKGDTLILTRCEAPGRPARTDAAGEVEESARISCMPSEALDRVRAGERIWFDDGRIGGVIRSVAEAEVTVEITAARPAGDKLGADKGINLPDSDLPFPSLTAKDLESLPFVARHADLVGYSFVRTAEDVEALQAKLAESGAEQLGIILKIETQQAFEQLPNLLLAAMRSPLVGVMIARGDLAVECGFARLAEVQEEILWICEAAHVPVIWATQVLEQLAKSGRPSRAEVTDAAMAERAECVMLNKGPYATEAVRALDSILRRMQTHQQKKRSMLRHLHLADGFFRDHEGFA